jgi:hypothetical protein
LRFASNSPRRSAEVIDEHVHVTERLESPPLEDRGTSNRPG